MKVFNTVCLWSGHLHAMRRWHHLHLGDRETSLLLQESAYQWGDCLTQGLFPCLFVSVYCNNMSLYIGHWQRCGVWGVVCLSTQRHHHEALHYRQFHLSDGKLQRKGLCPYNAASCRVMWLRIFNIKSSFTLRMSSSQVQLRRSVINKLLINQQCLVSAALCGKTQSDGKFSVNQNSLLLVNTCYLW